MYLVLLILQSDQFKSGLLSPLTIYFDFLDLMVFTRIKANKNSKFMILLSNHLIYNKKKIIFQMIWPKKQEMLIFFLLNVIFLNEYLIFNISRHRTFLFLVTEKNCIIGIHALWDEGCLRNDSRSAVRFLFLRNSCSIFLLLIWIFS